MGKKNSFSNKSHPGAKNTSFKKSGSATSTTAKGRTAEQIVKEMHSEPRVKAQTNVRLRPRSGKGRRREIDLLLSGIFAGYPVEMPFEIKNEAKPVGSPKIDAFRGKLGLLGKPTSHSAYVSTSGYTKGALDAANDANIRALVLTGLDKGGMPISIQADQYVLFLLPEILNIVVENRVQFVGEPSELFLLYNKEGHPCAYIPDIVWQKWQNEQIPTTIGKKELELIIPSDWHQIIAGKVEKVISIKVPLWIIGLAIKIPGKATNHALVNALDNNTERFVLKATFDLEKDQYELTRFLTEGEFEESIVRTDGLKMSIGRFLLPRISVGHCFWPPSERVAQIMINQLEAHALGKAPDPRPFKFSELEGVNLVTVWEPIYSDFPGLKHSSAGDVSVKIVDMPTGF